MRVLIADTEADHVDPDQVTKIHIFGYTDLATGHRDVWRGFKFDPDTGRADSTPAIPSTLKENILWVFHNGMQYDIPLLHRFFGEDFIPKEQVYDTFVVSRMYDFNKFRTHSLKEWGEFLRCHKGDFNGPWDVYSKEMEDYWEQDLVVGKKVYEYLSHYQKSSDKSLKVEHETASICYDIQKNGFHFNEDKAMDLLHDIKGEMARLEDSFQKSFPPKLVEDKRLKIRYTKDGVLFKGVTKAMEEYGVDHSFSEDGEELICYKREPFDPASPKKRIDVLWDAGWNPTMKTKGHYTFTREHLYGKAPPEPERKKNFERYGWMCNEENLKTLPKTAPQAVFDLTKWLTFEGRRSSVVEWLQHQADDDKIHGKFWSIGAWTHRMSHSKPNSANIFSVFPDEKEPENAVEEVKKRYDGELRSCWEADPGMVLVGTDADAIQLRILAHYMKSERYIEAIVKGDKKLGTDIHNINKDALGTICRTRDDAKTFIYAWLLGAGTPKIASILGCSQADAKKAVSNFLDSFPELRRLKEVEIPRDAKRGYFLGLDGRRVPCRSEHLMLAGYLQNGESVVMKHANVLWDGFLRRKGLPFKQVNFVHDEWQTVTTSSSAERVGKVQCRAITKTGEALGLACPLSGSYKIGKNWKETH